MSLTYCYIITENKKTFILNDIFMCYVLSICYIYWPQQIIKKLAEETGVPYQNLINLYLQDCAKARKKLKLQWISSKRTAEQSA